jgi:uncharacterized protein with PQ loop repeat
VGHCGNVVFDFEGWHNEAFEYAAQFIQTLRTINVVWVAPINIRAIYSLVLLDLGVFNWIFAGIIAKNIQMCVTNYEVCRTYTYGYRETKSLYLIVR